MQQLPNRPRKILFIQTAFLGDVILATSALESWHARFPEDEISFLINDKFKSLLVSHPFAHIITWDKSKGKKWNSLLNLLLLIRRERFDAVINFQRYAATGMLTAWSGAYIKRGFDKSPWAWFFSQAFTHEYKENWHECDRNHQLIADLVDNTKPSLPKLYPQESDVLEVKRKLSAIYKGLSNKPIIILAPGSVWPTKIWPESHWALLIKRLRTDYLPILIGGKEEFRMCESLSKEGAVNWAGQLTLMQSTALMQLAYAAYVQDSAPMHLATAAGLPTCAIYCSTSPIFGFGPKAPQSRVYQVQNLACKPCNHKGLSTCPAGHFKCGIDLSPLHIPLPHQWLGNAHTSPISS